MKIMIMSMLILSLVKLTAQEIIGEISSGISLPTGPYISDIDSTPYQPGFKLDISCTSDFDLLPMDLQVKTGILNSPLKEAAEDAGLSLFSLQIGPGYSYELNNGIALSAFGQGGIYLAVYNQNTAVHGVLSCKGDVNYSIISNIHVGIGGEYSYYFSQQNDLLNHLWSGFSVHLNLRNTFP